MKNIINLLLVVFILGTINLVYAQSGRTLSEEVEALLQRAQELEERNEALKAVKAKLDKKDDDLEWTTQQLEKGFNDYLKKSDEHDARVTAHNRQVEIHFNECNGTFSDKSWVENCNRRGAELDREASRINDNKDYLDKEDANWKEIAKKLKQDANDLSNEYEKYERERAELDRQIDSWGDWFTRLTNWPTFDDLKAREKLSEICKALAPEEASECLKRVWDGAR